MNYFVLSGSRYNPNFLTFNEYPIPNNVDKQNIIATLKANSDSYMYLLTYDSFMHGYSSPYFLRIYAKNKKIIRTVHLASHLGMFAPRITDLMQLNKEGNNKGMQTMRLDNPKRTIMVILKNKTIAFFGVETFEHLTKINFDSNLCMYKVSGDLVYVLCDSGQFYIYRYKDMNKQSLIDEDSNGDKETEQISDWVDKIVQFTVPKGVDIFSLCDEGRKVVMMSTYLKEIIQFDVSQLDYSKDYSRMEDQIDRIITKIRPCNVKVGKILFFCCDNQDLLWISDEKSTFVANLKTTKYN